MRILKKLAIGLVIVAVVLAVAAWWIIRGDPAEHTLDKVSGTDPIIAQPDPQWIPTVGVAEPIGWGEARAPERAEALEFNRFREGLVHPGRIYTMPKGAVLVAESTAPERTVAGPNPITNWIAGLLFS